MRRGVTLNLEATAQRLAGLLDALEWDEVRLVCDQLVQDIAADPPRAFDWPWRAILGGLRRKRLFALLEQVSGSLLLAGLRDPQVVRQHAQALVEVGRVDDAERELRELVAEPSTPPAERDEARGLLGRIFKQRYVAGGDGASLQRALAEYWSAYSTNPAEYLWHGVNVVALLARAGADGVPISSEYLPAAHLAQQILARLDSREAEGRASAASPGTQVTAWDLATRLEAQLALGKDREALDTAMRYVGATGADAFELAATERQLREVWRLHERTDRHAPELMAVLRDALATTLGGEALPDQASSPVPRSDEERPVAGLEALVDGGMRTVPWLKAALECCSAIARIEESEGRGVGTGWMVRGSDLLDAWGDEPVLVTAKHVLSPPADGGPHQGARGSAPLLPEEATVFFQMAQQRAKVAEVLWSSAGLELDATVVRLTAVPDGVTTLRLSPRAVAPSVPAARIYVIGYPGGRDLALSLHDNRLLASDARRLHYRTPTEAGHAGSPVFDDTWRVVGVHHAGGRGIPTLDGTGTYDANEGISIEAIRRAARARAFERDRELRAEVRQHLSSMNTTYSGGAKRRFSPWHRAAAVLSTFDDDLAPAGEPTSEEAFEDVLADSDLVPSAGGRSRYQLRPEVRREVLRDLAAEGALAALAGQDTGANDARQRLFSQYLTGTAPPLAAQSTSELTASFEIASWLNGIVAGVPTDIEVRSLLDLASLLAPFEELAAHFRGRVNELNTLRDYVGVLPPSSSWSWLGRRARDFLDWHQKPPLVIYGTGGVGKSTLIGRFILEHARLGDDKRFPFAYLDFDRPDLVPSEPLTILVEAVRQLGVEWPELQADCERLRARWSRQLGRDPQGTQAPPATGAQERARFISDFAALLDTRHLADRPLLLVVDTFEQVQVRSRAFVTAICGFLRDLQAAAPRLRTVFCGRAPIEGVEVQPLPLAHLDPEAARGFLEGLGLSGEAAARVAARVGGNPLALHMARDLLWKLQRDTTGAEGLRRFEHEVAGIGSDPGAIQRLLYDRILAHVRDEDVRRLAHPGLVLRRVTPALIRQVLAGPCAISAAAAADPDALLARMTSEVWLVVPAGTGEVRHRPDVRKLMLPAMADDPRLGPKIGQIQEAAIAFYEQAYETSQDLADRAEEVYHRLLSAQKVATIDSRWVTGIERFLFSAVDELPPVQRAWLSVRLQIELDPVARAGASLEEWERDAERRVGQLLASGDASGAAGVLRERPERSDGSPLFLLEARVLEAQGDLAGAAEVLEDAVTRSFQAGVQALWRDLSITLADLEVRLGLAPKAARRLDEAGESAAHEEDRVAQLRIALIRLDLARATTTPAGSVPQVRELVEPLQDLLARLTDDEMAVDLAATRRAVGEVGAGNHDIVRRVLRIAGLGAPDTKDLVGLGVALEEWDRALLSRATAPPLPNAAALIKVLERGFSADEALALYRDRVAPELRRAGASYVATEEELRASEFPARRMVEVLERTGGLDRLVRAIEDLRPGAAAAARKSLGPVARRVDLQGLSEDGTLESFALTAMTGLAPALEQLWGAFTVPDAVRAAVAQILRRPPAAPRPAVARPHPRSGAVRLTPDGRRRLHAALVTAFLTHEDLRQLVFFGLNTNLDAISSGTSLLQIIQQLLTWADARGATAELVTAAVRARPASPELQAVADELGLTASFISPDDRLELTGRLEAAGFHDVAGWRRVCGEMAGRVCRIDAEGPSVRGTGFLIARDLVLTAHTVVSKAIERGATRPAISALFDYRAVEGAEIDPGIRAGAATDWLVAHDAALDFAVLRLERPLADEPIGGDRALPNAPPRGWVPLPTAPASGFAGLVVILQHPRAGPLQIAFDPAAGADATGGFVQYRASTEGGSAGAPCFSADWRLVAMHQGRAPTLTQWNLKRGIAIERIVERLPSDLFAPRYAKH